MGNGGWIGLDRGQGQTDPCRGGTRGALLAPGPKAREVETAVGSLQRPAHAVPVFASRSALPMQATDREP